MFRSFRVRKNNYVIRKYTYSSPPVVGYSQGCSHDSRGVQPRVRLRITVGDALQLLYAPVVLHVFGLLPDTGKVWFGRISQ